MSQLSAAVSRVRAGVERVRGLFRLTDRMCRQAGPGRHSDGGNLHLRVRPTSKTFVVRLTIDGRRRDFVLGRYPDVTLAEARDLAAEYRRRVWKGEDPGGGSSRVVPTVQECLEPVIEDRQHGWTEENAAARYRARFNRYIRSTLGAKRVDAVTVDDCLALIRPLWRGRGSRGFTIRHQLVHIFSWAIAQEYRLDNPAVQVVARLPTAKSSGKHLPSLPYARVPAALAALDAADLQPVVRLVLSFIILTACRLREATEAQWSEVDLDHRLWTVVPSRAKKRRRHRVPLSTQAVEILEEAHSLDPSGVLVFGFRRGRRRPRALTSRELIAVLRDLGLTDGEGRSVTVHGFRSTFTDWAADHEAASVETAEAALGHAADSPTRRAYRRGDLLKPRHPLMQKWADYCYSGLAE